MRAAEGAAVLKGEIRIVGLPNTPEIRRFYRCGRQRWVEANILRKAEQTTGAVYLAGYAVECMLKALVLSTHPEGKHREVLLSFRGNLGHDLEWLRDQYLLHGGARLPRDVTRAFTFVSDWSTDLRYQPKTLKAMEADAFLQAVEAIMNWADGRL